MNFGREFFYQLKEQEEFEEFIEEYDFHISMNTDLQVFNEDARIEYVNREYNPLRYGGEQQMRDDIFTGDHLQPIRLLRSSYLQEVAKANQEEQKFVSIINTSNEDEEEKRKQSMALSNATFTKINIYLTRSINQSKKAFFMTTYKMQWSRYASLSKKNNLI